MDCVTVLNKAHDGVRGKIGNESNEDNYNNHYNINLAVERITQPHLEQIVHDFEKHAAQCILKLCEKHILPTTVQ